MGEEKLEGSDDIALKIRNLLLSEDSPIDMTDEMKEKLEKLFEGYKQLSDEDKEEFRQSMTSQLADKVVGSLNNDLDKITAAMINRNLLVIAAVFLLFMVFVFFGYKLYKSLKERERKREEKRKMKQQKKKK
ncbi:uncharacterized protein [Anabrus simplex]|uniref:uncharacterized protein isoform X1 n=1 Tax=Anabrus simplex TaxID=316456 RepID=UPI0035A279E7